MLYISDKWLINLSVSWSMFWYGSGSNQPYWICKAATWNILASDEL